MGQGTADGVASCLPSKGGDEEGKSCLSLVLAPGRLHHGPGTLGLLA